MSFTKKVVSGLVGGALCGLFFGERIAPAGVLATGFIKLMQMMVLPYVVISIVSSLGSLNYAEARKLGLRVGTIIAGLWGVAVGFAFLVPLTFPTVDTGAFFSTSLVEQRPPFNFVDLYIPSNPFHSMANNVVPATVLFAVALGIALIGVPEKQRLLEVLRVAMETVSRATRLVTRLTPYGVFAIAAQAAGTLSFEQMGRLEIFLISYVAIALLLALWVLPGLVGALTPVPVRDLIAFNRSSLITAFVAGDLFIVLPTLMEACEQILLRHQVGAHDEHKLPEVIVPASFNFPHAGKLLSLSFILFAGWFSDSALPLRDYPQLAGAGVLTIFGSLNAAIPFLLDLFRIPADTFQLYIATGVLNARFGSLLAAIHVITVAILGSAALAGALRFHPARLVRYAAVTLVLTAGTIGGLRAVFANVLSPRFEGAEIIRNMRPLYPHETSVVVGVEAQRREAAPGQDGVYGQILSRGVLRVGFFQNRVPFVFVNGQGSLVGYEVEAAHLLARDIGVKPQFIQLDTRTFVQDMASGRADIIMSAVVLTPRREGAALFSRSYLDETLALVMLDHRRGEFTEWASIRKAGALRLAAPNYPHYLALLHDLVPRAEIVPVAPEDLKLDEKSGFDAYVMAAEFGAAQTLLNPRFSVVVPAPGLIKVPLAYPLAKRDRQWEDVVDTWIELRQKDGTFDALYRHWILGQTDHQRRPRWSVFADVLHWGR